MALLERDSRMMSSLRGGGERPPFEGIYVYLFTLLLGYISADLALLSQRDRMLPETAAPVFQPPASADVRVSSGEYQTIRQRNLFNADGMIPPALSAEETPGTQVDAPAVLSQLPLKLEGTIVHLNPNRSVASVVVQSKSESKAYMIEDEIEGMARVTKIERRKLTFRNLNNNRLEYIEIPKDSLITFGLKDQPVTEAGGEVQKQGDFEFSLRREDLNKYTSDLSAILNQARMVPNIVPGSGGRVEGFRFVNIQPNSIYEKLGFKPGDVIKEVNGEPVNSPTKGMELYNALRSENRIRLSVERDGRVEAFTYDVKE